MINKVLYYMLTLPPFLGGLSAIDNIRVNNASVSVLNYLYKYWNNSAWIICVIRTMCGFERIDYDLQIL